MNFYVSADINQMSSFIMQMHSNSLRLDPGLGCHLGYQQASSIFTWLVHLSLYLSVSLFLFPEMISHIFAEWRLKIKDTGGREKKHCRAALVRWVNIKKKKKVKLANRVQFYPDQPPGHGHQGAVKATATSLWRLKQCSPWQILMVRI